MLCSEVAPREIELYKTLFVGVFTGTLHLLTILFFLSSNVASLLDTESQTRTFYFGTKKENFRPGPGPH